MSLRLWWGSVGYLIRYIYASSIRVPLTTFRVNLIPEIPSLVLIATRNKESRGSFESITVISLSGILA